jgi:metal-responsive CopG/Arc/MetJ family transcriptional regulator
MNLIFEEYVLSHEVDAPSESRSVQIILKVPEAFLKKFDKIVTELGYTRTEAIREAMRRFQSEGEKRQAEKPEVVAEIVSKAYIDQWKKMFEAMSPKKVIMQSSQLEEKQQRQ